MAIYGELIVIGTELYFITDITKYDSREIIGGIHPCYYHHGPSEQLHEVFYTISKKYACTICGLPYPEWKRLDFNPYETDNTNFRGILINEIITLLHKQNPPVQSADAPNISDSAAIIKNLTSNDTASNGVASDNTTSNNTTSNNTTSSNATSSDVQSIH